MRKIVDMYGRESYIEDIPVLDSCIIPNVRNNRREDLLDDNCQSWKQFY